MNRVKFVVNGKSYSVGSEVDSATTLLDFIRDRLNLRGTKYMCREAGCGACIVAVNRQSQPSQGINACMVPVTSCEGWEVTTIEGIGNRLVGYHSLQQTLASTNGTQCGYCSPGWIMAMYSLLSVNKMTMSEIEQSLGSNVCRCTGYRPILDAFKKYATDAPGISKIMDIEDLSICAKTGEVCSPNKCDEADWCVISNETKGDKVKKMTLRDDKEWYRVESLPDIFNILNVEGFSDSYMLVAGNTAKGVFQINDYPKVLIDISGIKELKGYYLDQNLVIGTGNTLTDLVNILNTISDNDNFTYLKSLSNHLKLVGHIPLKNLATIGGNLYMKNQNPGFKSDIFLILATVGAQVTILSDQGAQKTVSMRGLLKEDITKKILLNILLPPLNNNHQVVTFKVMPRSQNAHALINCGFLYEINNNTVMRCRLCYSGLSKNFVRAINTEKYLIGKTVFNNETLQAALKVLNEEIVITTSLPDVTVEYKRHLALALFYKGLLSLCPSNVLSPRYASGVGRLHDTRPVSSGRQSFDIDPRIWPLNKPMPKVDALIQCAGEAQYSEDLPSQPNEVFAAFVLTTVGQGTINQIDSSEALNEPGVIAFYTADDIPGVNSFIPKGRILLIEDEEVLCSGEVKYHGQPLGIIVAETRALAEKAAKMVTVTYSDVKIPVVDVKKAKDHPEKTSLFTSIEATKIGSDVTKVIKGDNTVYGQYHFTMETLVCVTHPTEEGMKVYTATQWSDIVQQMTAKVLKMDQNRIDVNVRRLGGGYGYKITRATLVATACNLVVSKLNRPCRFINSMQTNMKAVGKRLPCYSMYELGVNKEGVIQYVKIDLYTDNGCILAEDLLLLMGDCYLNCYNGAPWAFKAYNVLTDTASNTWCRSPTTLECIAVAEWMMEQITYEQNLDPFDVRLANLDTENYNDLNEMAVTLKMNSNYLERKALIEKFNAQYRWKKRGLRCSFMRWTPVAFLYFDINLAVYHEDGTVIITHGGIEMGQGINTVAIQICAHMLNIDVEKIQVKPNDTITSPNNFCSGGSVTTQNVGIGVQKCCKELLLRLEPIRAQMDNPTWEELVKTAHASDIDLQIHGFINASDIQSYHIYGCTLAEVEIDVLTGEWEIIRVDLLEDVGRTVNQDIDVGQVEGGFIMGVGYWTTEDLIYDPTNGELLTDRTWEYWIPQARDIPQDFRISFRNRSYSTDAILGAKATGEPATCMSIVIAMAMREAIVAARSDSEISRTKWFNIDGPYTVEKICMNTSTKTEDFKFY